MTQTDTTTVKAARYSTIDVEGSGAISNSQGNDVLEKFELEDDTPLYNLSQRIFTFISCLTITYVVGFSHTSFNLVKTISLEKWSSTFYPEFHATFALLPPTFFYLGASIGCIVMLCTRKYRHLFVAKIAACMFFLGSIFNIGYPHIIVVFLTRFIFGLASGISNVVVPQILYKLAPKEKKAFFSALYPVSLLTGLTSAVALIPLSNSTYFFYINSIPIVFSAIAFGAFFKTLSLNPADKETLDKVIQKLCRFDVIKTTFSVIFIHIFQKTTGVDFIGNFSSIIFIGDNEYLYGLSPLIFATILTFFTSFFTDKIGRKIPIVGGLGGISIICFTIYSIGPTIWLVLMFILFYNFGLSNIPYFYQNEIVKAGNEAMVNEIGSLTNWLLGLAVAIFVAFIYTKSSSLIWLVFSILSAIGCIVAAVTMIETMGVSMETKDYIKSWNNITNWRRKKEIIYN
ncbi:Membrane transporter D1 [Nosema granulosis]|uniref:Membrane transporter D1 n=1 Tax=Nosema granulosis TaxID=83296 RepID=A0A9P6L0U2_9MICR|nr:Membrane transporter D1 [Nosema granulosis]